MFFSICKALTTLVIWEGYSHCVKWLFIWSMTQTKPLPCYFGLANLSDLSSAACSCVSGGTWGSCHQEWTRSSGKREEQPAGKVWEKDHVVLSCCQVKPQQVKTKLLTHPNQHKYLWVCEIISVIPIAALCPFLPLRPAGRPRISAELC